MAEQGQTDGVTLWDLLTLISLAAPVGSACAAAKVSHVGLAGYALAILVGLAIGLCCAVCMRLALLRVVGYLIQGNVSERGSIAFAGLMLVAAFIWIVVGGLAGGWLTGKLLNIFV